MFSLGMLSLIMIVVVLIGTILASESKGHAMTALATPDAATSPGRGPRVFVSRLYFYGVALISLITGIIALDNLLYVLDRAWLDQGLGAVHIFNRDAVASNGGLLLVATPIYVLHWGFVQRRLDAAEQASALRKLFLYIASGVAAGYSLFSAYVLLNEATRLALGSPLIESAIWPSGWLHRLLIVAIGLALLRYFQGIAFADGDRGAEIGWAGTWRRLYQTLLGLAGLALVIWGIGSAIDLLVGDLLVAPAEFLRSGWARDTLADDVAKALVGLVLLRINWQRWRRLADVFPEEAQAALRRFYLYVAVVAGALTVLLPLGGLLNDVLRVLFGVLAWSDSSMRDTLTLAIAYAPVGLVVWLWHWRFLEREAAAHGESEAGATIRRLYYYVVAATGLVLLWLGLVEIVQVLLDVGLRSPEMVGDRFWANPLATGLSLLTVGAPIWAYHWQRMQAVARRDEATGQAERASAPRKVYLYGVALVSALVVLFFLGQVVYRILLIALGDPNASMSELTTVADLARSLIAAGVWVMHVLAIRGDGRFAGEIPAPAEPTVDERRAALVARIAHLEQELAAARAELAALPPDQPATAA